MVAGDKEDVTKQHMVAGDREDVAKQYTVAGDKEGVTKQHMIARNHNAAKQLMTVSDGDSDVAKQLMTAGNQDSTKQPIIAGAASCKFLLQFKELLDADRLFVGGRIVGSQGVQNAINGIEQGMLMTLLQSLAVLDYRANIVDINIVASNRGTKREY